VITDVKLRSNYNPRSLVFTIGFSAGVVALPWQRGQSNVSIGMRAIYWFATGSEVARDGMCSTAHFYIDAE